MTEQHKRTSVSVSDEHLDLVLARMREAEGAKLRFDATRDGIDIVGNRAAWLALARWCLVMAHPEHGDDEPPIHLDWDVLPDAARRGDLTYGFWGLEKPECGCQNVSLWRRDDPSGPIGTTPRLGLNSPYTATAADVALGDLKALDHAPRSRVVAALGRPVSETHDEDGTLHLVFHDGPYEIEVWLGSDDRVCGMALQILRTNAGEDLEVS